MNLKIVDKNQKTLFSQKGTTISGIYHGEYSDGDKLIITASEYSFLKLQLDEALKESIIYVPSGKFEYKIPFGTQKIMYAPEAFSGEKHLISVSEATEEEAYCFRNIALNPHDVQGQKIFSRMLLPIL